MDGPLGCYRLCVSASSMHTMYPAHGGPIKWCPLGQPRTGQLNLLLDPGRGVLSDCSAQLGACLYRVPSLQQYATQRSVCVYRVNP